MYCYVHRRPRPEHDTDLDTGDIVIDPAVFPAAGVKSVGVAAGTKDRVHSSQQVRELLDNGPPKPQRWVSESSRAYASVTRVVTDENEPRVAAAGTTSAGCLSTDTGILLRAAHYYPMHARAVEDGGSPWETTSRAAYGPRGAVVPVTRGRPSVTAPATAPASSTTVSATTGGALGKDADGPVVLGEAQSTPRDRLVSAALATAAASAAATSRTAATPPPKPTPSPRSPSITGRGRGSGAPSPSLASPRPTTRSASVHGSPRPAAVVTSPRPLLNHAQPKANLESVASVISPPRVRTTEDALQVVHRARQELASPRPGTAGSIRSAAPSVDGAAPAGLATRPASALGGGRARVPHRSDALTSGAGPAEAFPLTQGARGASASNGANPRGTTSGTATALATAASLAAVEDVGGLGATAGAPQVALVQDATLGGQQWEEHGFVEEVAHDAVGEVGLPDQDVAPVALDFGDGGADEGAGVDAGAPAPVDVGSAVCGETADGETADGVAVTTGARPSPRVPSLWPSGTTPRGAPGNYGGRPGTMTRRNLTVNTTRSHTGSHKLRAVVASPPVPSHYTTFRRPFTVSFDPQSRTQVARHYNPITAHPRYPPDPKLLRPTTSEYKTQFAR